jgi:exonuclease SbcC
MFEHQGNTYSVVRERYRGKKTALYFNIDGPGGRTSLTAPTIKETQEKICQTLHLDDDLLVATSLIMQGGANEFTRRPAGQRKAMLASILRLELYDELQDAAKNKVAAVKKDIAAIEVEARIAAEKIASGSDTEVQLSTARGVLTEQQLNEQQASEELDLLCAEKVKQDAMQEKAKELDIKVLDAQRDLDVATVVEKDLHNHVEMLLEQLSNADDVRHNASLYERAKEFLNEHRDDVKLIQGFKEQADMHNRAVSDALKAHSAAKTRRSSECTSLDQVDALKALYGKYTALKAEIERDDEQLSTIAELKKFLDIAKEAAYQADMTANNAKTLLDRTAQSARMLEDSRCVNAEAAAVQPCEFMERAAAAKQELPRLEAEYSRLLAASEAARSDLAIKLERYSAAGGEEIGSAILRKRQQLRGMEAEALKYTQLEGIRKLAEELDAQIEELSRRIDDSKDQRDKCLAEIANRKDIIQQLKDAKETMARYSSDAQTATELPVLEERLKNAQEKWLEATESLKKAQHHYSVVREEMRTHSMESPIRDIRAEIEEQTKAYEAARGAVDATQKHIGRLEEKLSAIKEAEATVASAASKTEPLIRQLTVWNNLVTAFGRNGIPALIIENAIPELERVANNILEQMTNGEHRLRLETQRELKSRDGLGETLDIIVADWQGERPYETFSGGEQLRIDLALRFALGEMLATRASSRIEWAVLDEGIGSQDAEHRALVLEAIKAISERFAMLLVITHIDEAVGMFPQKINIARREGGVEVYVE